MTPFSPKDKPRVGYRIHLYDYTTGKYDNHEKIRAVMQAGLYGWIVQTESGLFVEVELVNTHGPSYAWKERPQLPKESNAKHKGH